MDYIRIPSVTEKLKKAVQSYSPVWISASTGFGKTAAVTDFFSDRSILCLSCRTGRLDHTPEPEKIRQGVVFVDDVTFLTDEASETYLSALLAMGGRELIFAGRGDLPAWLGSSLIHRDLVHITEHDLALQPAQIITLFHSGGLTISEDDAAQIFQRSCGCPVAVLLYAQQFLSGRTFCEATCMRVEEDFFHYLDRNIFETYESELCYFLLALAPYPVLTEEFAEFVTGNHSAAMWFGYLRRVGKTLVQQDDGSWTMRAEAARFLMWKRSQLYSKEKQQDNYRRAACYFEFHHDVEKALAYYDMAQAQEAIKELLIKNAHQHPGTGHYFQTRKYYFQLPEEEITENPTLMTGMSMLCSLLLDPEGSERWYARLQAFAKDKSRPRHQIREAKNQIAYLDIALPHRAGAGIIKIMRNTFQLVRSGEVKLREFSVTSNLPSIMNGGLDFCKWSKNDNDIARFMGKPLETVLGKHGKGLVDIALAESYFEKGTENPYDVVTRLNNGISDAGNGGKLEIVFAATGLLVKQHLLEGQYQTAKRRLEAFGQKIADEEAAQLQDNFDAFCIWFTLYSGDRDAARRYLETAPNEQVGFYILDRFRYMVKIRCLIAEERLSEALDLASFLTRYFSTYRRTYLSIENEMLKAIILYRMNNENWQSVLTGALRCAEEYHFVRVFSLEGAAIIPLLRHLEESGVSSDFLRAVTDEAMRMSLYYPDYLKYTPKRVVHLTDREMQVLAMLCGGLSTEEICTECGISYSGLKKHNRSIYQKLGVKNRVEAERTALQLGIIHRREADL